MKSVNEEAGFTNFALKSVAVHTLTYFIFGLIFSNLFHYGELFGEEVINNFMRPIDSPYVLLGPFLQPIRGLLFAIAIWLIRPVLEEKYGWLKIWALIVFFGILSTPAAAPCSVEGLLYTQLPLTFHLIGFPEILLQTLAYSFFFVAWVKRSANRKSTIESSKSKKLVQKFGLILMIACFGYIGYAMGSILMAKIAGKEIKVSGTSVNMRGQLMFVFAFIINIISLFVIVSKKYFGKMSLRVLFLYFWLIDSLSPLFYQFYTGRVMPIHFAFFIGVFPALIIITSYKLNYKNFASLINE